MRILLFLNIFFFAVNILFAAPLESGYPLAPRAAASPEEKQRAYLEARNRVISSALKYENTPYRYGGITSAGLDCSGFIYLSFRDALGVSTPRSASALYSWAEKIPLDNTQPGDLLFFRTDGTGRVTHVGLYLGNRRFIHAASAGPRTGVIINTLDEGNWANNYAGAGRVFPEAVPGFLPDNAANTRTNTRLTGNETRGNSQAARIPGSNNTSGGASGQSESRYLLGIAFAPVFKNPFSDGNVVRGFSSQLRFGADTKLFGKSMILGLEIRPEYDGMYGVFSLPITLSWGYNDKLRVFAGPVYTAGKTGWYGIIGVTLSPFIVSTPKGELAPYAEALWQSNSLQSGFIDGFCFTAGIRWTIKLKM